MDQSLDDVIKGRREAAKAAKTKLTAPSKVHKHHHASTLRGPKANKAKHHQAAAQSDTPTTSFGTAEQLGMSLDDLLAAKRPSVKARPPVNQVSKRCVTFKQHLHLNDTPVFKGAKLRNAAIHGAKAKRQATWNQTRGLPGKTNRTEGPPVTFTIRNSMALHHPAAGAHQRRPHPAHPARDNTLRRVNVGKHKKHHLRAQVANDDDDDDNTASPPRLHAWEQHSLEHPTKFNLPEGTNFKISIDLNRVSSVVGIDASSGSDGPGVSLRQ